MIDEAEYQRILQHLQRPINCLADEDRNIRKSGLDTIKKQISKMSKENVLKLFNETKLTAMLIKITNDKIQNNRQLGLQITELLIKITAADGRSLYEQLLPSLIVRINETPFPEKSEDLRLKVVNIMIKLMPYKECFYKHLPEIGSALSKCLADAYDEIKYSACDLTNKLSQALPQQIGKYSLNIILSLKENLKHQKFKVRKTSMESIGQILVTNGAGGNFEQIRVGIKSVLSDKKEQVRASAYQCIGHLILYMGPKYMKQYEPHLIGLLLMGLEDGSQAIVDKVLEILQKCGSKLKEEEGEMVNENVGNY